MIELVYYLHLQEARGRYMPNTPDPSSEGYKLQSQNWSLKTENEGLKRLLGEKENLVEKEKNEAARLRGELRRLEGVVARLEGEQDGFFQLIQQQKTEIKVLNGRLEKNTTDSQKEKQRLEETITTLRQDIAAKESQIKAEKSQLEASKEALRVSGDNVNKQIAEIEQKNQLVQGTLKEETAELLKLLNKRDSSLAEQQQRLDDYEGKFRVQADKNKALVEENDGYKSRIAELEKSLKSSQSSIARSKEVLERDIHFQFRHSINKLEGTLNDKSEQLCKEVVTATQGMINELKKEYGATEERKKILLNNAILPVLQVLSTKQVPEDYMKKVEVLKKEDCEKNKKIYQNMKIIGVVLLFVGLVPGLIMFGIYYHQHRKNTAIPTKMSTVSDMMACAA